MTRLSTSPRAVALALLVLALPLLAVGTPTAALSVSETDSDLVVSRSATPAPASVVARARGITATAPSLVTGGSRIKVTGTVLTFKRGVGRARPVQLAERVAGRWVVVGKARATKQGRFTISTAAGQASRTRTLRVQAPKANGLRAVQTNLKVEVLRGSDDWSYLWGPEARWNPCAPITWTYNPAGQAYDALADVRGAFDRIAVASGLTFEYAGSSSVVYLGSVSALTPGTGIAVGWANARQLASLTGSVVGVGGASGIELVKNVRYRLTRGWVTLDKDDTVGLRPGFAAGRWGPIILHEVLHALGLGHARLSRQLMYHTAGPGNATFGPGDRSGMARIGAGAGCL